jgi:hypothetical protein
MQLKLGRQPRTFNPRVPHMSAILARGDLPTPPLSVDYTAGMPDELGSMLNDSLGDCTCAAYYHARQIWTFNARGAVITEPDSDVLGLYEGACGYSPSDPTTDQGGVEQDVLTYLLNTGAPVGADGSQRDKILAFLEVDFRNLDDLKRAIADCGIAYIGIDVPQSVMDSAGDSTVPWDYNPSNAAIVGGHAIVLAAYDLDTFTCISWGKRYKLTHNFLAEFLDEAYAIADPAWIRATGKTPLGMSVQGLEAQMAGLRMAA